MNGSGEAVARRAESLVGTRFRLHGRDPSTGLDCLGLVGECLAAAGCPIRLPTGYRLRNYRCEAWLQQVDLSGLVPIESPDRRGDIVLIKPSIGQHHCLITTGSGHMIHAHAHLRRVVRQCLPDRLQMIAGWRLT
jgi:cell wall-associated NlpC family hydrolase